MADPEPIRVRGNYLDVERGDSERIGHGLGVCALLAVGLDGQAQHHLAGRMHAQEDRSVSLVSHSWTSPRLT